MKKRDRLAELEQRIPDEQLVPSQALTTFYAPKLDDTHSQVGPVLTFSDLDNLSGPDLIAQLSSLQRYNAGRAALLNCVITVIQRRAAADDKERRQIFLTSCKINHLNATRFRRGLLVACQLLIQRDSVKKVSKSWLDRYARTGFFPWSAVYSQNEAYLADSALCDEWMASGWAYYAQARAADSGLLDITIPVKKWKFPGTETTDTTEGEDEEEAGEEGVEGEEGEEGEEGNEEAEGEGEDAEELEEERKVLGKRQRKATTAYSPSFTSPEKGSPKKKRDVRVKQEDEPADPEIQVLKEENEDLTQEVKALKKQLKVAKKVVAQLRGISVRQVKFIVID